MSNLTVSQVYPVTADALWALIGSPESLASWHPAIATSSVEGARRQCILADGATVVEEITGHSDSERQYSYTILESPLPLSSYRSTLRVEALANGARLVWESDFEAAGAPTADVEDMLRGLYQAGLDTVAAQLSC